MSYRILGYSNPLDIHSVPVITIIKKGDNISALFPDLSIKALNVSNLDNMSRHKSFHLEKKEKYISEQEYTFLSIDGDFYTKNELLMLDVMKHELTLLKRDDYCREMLEELIVSESLKLKKLNFNQANFIFVKLYSTTRLKSNKEKAKRIILQHLRKGNYKTDYKKNYYSDDISNTTDLGRVYKTFNSTLHKLSKRYNNLDLQNLSIHNIPQLSSV